MRGILFLRKAIATYLKEFRGMTVLPEQIIVGAGTGYLYGLLIQLFGKDKVYAVENPGYRKIPQIYKSWQVPCQYIDMDNDGVKVSELEEKKADILHTPHPITTLPESSCQSADVMSFLAGLPGEQTDILSKTITTASFA